MGLYIHAITHDLSKFRPSEFFPYAEHFYSGRKDFWTEQAFNVAWYHHQHRNKHHWGYWVNEHGEAQPMPRKYVRQMIADWRGMSRKFRDTPREYYLANRDKMILHPLTVLSIEKELAL
jgi:hypothetical protein